MEALRPLLITYAYNILGSYEDAKDIVQDAYLRFMQIGNEQLENKRSYLVRIVINLSINLKNRQKKLVAGYPGEWLPEPVATEKADTLLNSKDVLSYSLMVLLEKLNAKQRAVFILKEAFDYEHEEIAEVLEINVENSRKLLSRAKNLLQTDKPVSANKIPIDYFNKYLQIIQEGDTLQLEQLLQEDVLMVSDGGGKAAAAINPIVGRKDVVAMLQALAKKYYFDALAEKRWINHQPALFYYKECVLVTCMVFSFENDGLANLYVVRNPDKLRSLQKKI